MKAILVNTKATCRYGYRTRNLFSSNHIYNARISAQVLNQFKPINSYDKSKRIYKGIKRAVYRHSSDNLITSGASEIVRGQMMDNYLTRHLLKSVNNLKSCI